MSRSTNQEAFPQLETKRLILRKMRPEDAEEIFHIYGDEEVMRYRDVLAFTRLEEAQHSFFRTLTKRWRAAHRVSRTVKPASSTVFTADRNTSLAQRAQ